MAEIPESVTRSLRVSGLSKWYGGRPALEDVTFSIHPGEVLGLIVRSLGLEALLAAPVGTLSKGERKLWSKTDSTSEFKDYVVRTK